MTTLKRDDLLIEEYNIQLETWDQEGKVSLVPKGPYVELHYLEGVMSEMNQVWEALTSHEKICIATLVCLHFGIAIKAEDLACMTTNQINSPKIEVKEQSSGLKVFKGD